MKAKFQIASLPDSIKREEAAARRGGDDKFFLAVVFGATLVASVLITQRGSLLQKARYLWSGAVEPAPAASPVSAGGAQVDELVAPQTREVGA